MLFIGNEANSGKDAISLGSLLTTLMLFNFALDYLSLAQTRHAISLLEAPKDRRSLTGRITLPFVVIIYDFIVTFTLALCFILFLSPYIESIDSYFIQPVWRYILGLESEVEIAGLLDNIEETSSLTFIADYWKGDGRSGFLGLFVCSTFLTSAWLWFFIAGSYLAKIFSEIIKSIR